MRRSKSYRTVSWDKLSTNYLQVTRFYGTSLYPDFLGDLIFLGLIFYRLTLK